VTGIVGGPVRVGPVLGMRVVIGIPRPLTRAAMNHALEALTRINVDWLRDNPNTPDLYSSGVTYALEPTGYELWDPMALLLARGAGDCDDLACARAAELRVREGDRRARADCYPSSIREGRRTWHAIVVRGDGTIEDPSARLGMPTHAGHLPDGAPFAEVLRKHEHLEGENPDPGAQNMIPSLIKWRVCRSADGRCWEGSIWIPVGNRGTMAFNQQARSPGDALEAVITAAEQTVRAAQSNPEIVGFNVAAMIPGLLQTGAQLVRTFTGQPSDPSPSSLPPQLMPLAQVAQMRQPGEFYGPPQYGPPQYGPPQYGPPQPPQWGAPAPQWGAPAGKFFGPQGYGPKA
jgi:hypothetical protein